MSYNGFRNISWCCIQSKPSYPQKMEWCSERWPSSVPWRPSAGSEPSSDYRSELLHRDRAIWTKTCSVFGNYNFRSAPANSANKIQTSSCPVLHIESTPILFNKRKFISDSCETEAIIDTGSFFSIISRNAFEMSYNRNVYFRWWMLKETRWEFLGV